MAATVSRKDGIAQGFPFLLGQAFTIPLLIQKAHQITQQCMVLPPQRLHFFFVALGVGKNRRFPVF